jgi:hypothetical protein
VVGGKAGVTATLVMGESKVLALATHSDSEEVLNITAGSGGGKLSEYKDTTEEGEKDKQAEQDLIVVQQQKLNNLWRTSSGERLSG